MDISNQTNNMNNMSNKLYKMKQTLAAENCSSPLVRKKNVTHERDLPIHKPNHNALLSVHLIIVAS
jgi:hypothetical protein